MQQPSLRYFIVRTFIAVIPVIVFVAVYAAIDPFKVIYRYDEPISSTDSIQLGRNAGFISIKALERNMRAGREYDSFILGSSMSGSFPVAEWKKHLPEGARAIHLDAAGETVQGIADKVRYLRDNGIKAKHILIIMEVASFERIPKDAQILFMRPPNITSDVSWVQFHYQYFNAFKNPTFVKYLLYQYVFFPQEDAGGMIMGRFGTTDLEAHVDSTNENLISHIDSIIAIDPKKYYTPARLRHNEYTDLPTAIGTSIRPETERSLVELAHLLKEGEIDYHIIIPPRLNRGYLSSYDLGLLIEMFGAERVHDMTRHPLSTEPCAYYDPASHLTTATSITIMHEALP